MLNMIIDRKQSDVTRAKTLTEKAKKVETLTPSELTEYLAGLKGCYNISDLNRVENAVKYVSDLLNSLNYPNTVYTKTWVEGSLFTISEMSRYLTNLTNLKNAYFIKSTTPVTPTSYKSPEQANNIEKILVDLEDIMLQMKQNVIYSGVASCGQSRVWQQRFRRPKVWNTLKFKISYYEEEKISSIIETSISNNTLLNPKNISSHQEVKDTIFTWNNYNTNLDNLIGGAI